MRLQGGGLCGRMGKEKDGRAKEISQSFHYSVKMPLYGCFKIVEKCLYNIWRGLLFGPIGK